MSTYAGDLVKIQFQLYEPFAPFGAADPDLNTAFTAVLVRNGANSTVPVVLTRLGTGSYLAETQVPVVWKRGDDVSIVVTATIDGVTEPGTVWSDTLSAGTTQPPAQNARATGQQGNPDHFGGAQVKAKRPTIQARAGHAVVVRHNLYVHGVPIDMASYGFNDSELGGVSEPAPNIVARITEMSGCDGEEIYVDLLDADQALVQFEVPESISNVSGIWLIEFAILTAEAQRFFAGDAYLYIERSLQSAQGARGAPMIPEVRLFLRDYAQENELLDVVDFDASEIALSADLCVAEWNEALPPDGRRYTTHTFPYRRNWLVGISSYLFGIAAEHYARNALAYQAGGVSADDKGKHQLYMQKSMLAKQEWRQFVAERKIVDSINSGGYLEIDGVM
jgi:hypothetical protein